MTVVRNEFETGENSPEQHPQPAHDGRRLRVAQLRQVDHRQPQPTSSACRSSNLQAFYRKYYQPDNAMLIVAGKFDEAKALELVAKYFGAAHEARARSWTTTYTEEPAQDGERHRRRCAASARSAWSASCTTSRPAPHPDFAAVEVLARS